MAYSLDKIDKILAIIRDANLIAPKEMLCGDKQKLIEICNGVGSANMPEWARDRTTKFFSSIEASAAIHDFMYEFADGTLLGQEKADNIFLLNGIDEIYFLYKWWNWRRYVARIKLMMAYDILRSAGKYAYLQSYFKKNNIN